ncbi:MAG TPA: flavin reductase [Bacteroidales bacterium]|jgi:flavin reductase (DIM6/NTAB) family NADH-FMN oxidoreductase RutF|nr:flavin reductase [Bacteroidales bacterium]
MKTWDTLFTKQKPEEIKDNLFEIIGKEWFLISAGTPDNFNMMTASWGTMGVFWQKPITICFVRPTRYTFGFMEDSDVYTLSFLGNKNKDVHKVCGSKSGRDTNKIKETGLLPVTTGHGGITYEQARLVVECKKIYFDDLKPVFFLPDEIEEGIYPNKDYHRVYYGEILNVYVKK